MIEFNTYDREKLYKEVWEKPVVEVAQQYGVSDVTIHKVCKALDIPSPPRGYWAKLRSGQEIERPELPPKKGSTTKTGMRTETVSKKSNNNLEELNFLTDDEKNSLLIAAEHTEIPDENLKLHKKVMELKSQIRSGQRNEYYRSAPLNIPENVSKEMMPRAFSILSVLYSQIEALGGNINNDFTMSIRGEQVDIEISEGQDKIKHELTKAEARQLLEYQDEKKRYRYATEPVFRKYDYEFNGKLRFSGREFRHIRDCGKANVEERIGEILIDLYIQSEQQRQHRLKQEEMRREREEEARLEEEKRQRENERRERYNEEISRTNALNNLASDYDWACRLRIFIDKIEEKSSYGEETAELVDWARKKADWYDPTVAFPDEYFGKRNHEDDKANKEPKEKTFRWY